MRLFISGSASLLDKIFNEFKHKFNLEILERYGMTETGINTTNPLNGNRVPGSVGLPMPETSIKIADEHDNEIADEKIGNIQVRGANVFCGYWNKEDQYKESFTEDGYFKTGDLGKKDGNGYIYIVGRSSDMIISGGINVYPKEIEILINKIEGVKESAIIGLPHPDFGEAVTAIIVKNNQMLQESDILSVIKKLLANYKIPKKILFVEEMPINSMGKIQKNVLRQMYHDLYI